MKKKKKTSREKPAEAGGLFPVPVRSFLEWYNYGFSGAVEQAATMERRQGLEFLGREVVTFANCDPNFLAEGRPDKVEFIMHFNLYLVGRMDERREALHLSPAQNSTGAERAREDMDPEELEEWKEEPPTRWE